FRQRIGLDKPAQQRRIRWPEMPRVFHGAKLDHTASLCRRDFYKIRLLILLSLFILSAFGGKADMTFCGAHVCF
ncbi:MAG: hypothetical protein WCF80_15265, partial [Pseudolabrys sp.]